MNVQIQQYINSGILEAYVTGSVTADEEREVLRLKQTYPEVHEALYQLEVDMEMLAATMAIPPPPTVWGKIEAEIDDIILREKTSPKAFIEEEEPTRTSSRRGNTPPQYIDIEAESSHMRIHKNWKWVFAAVFILGKLFLAAAIYFYLENRQAQQQIQELKTEIKARR
ncbi:hypothetical protein HQ865_08170 [Mucilaginibacter mali]|uniref:Anti-sigma factor n=1 Tax=Mucilaginibacter mali TaxID=2740462 RepID=A0A7D4TNC4_9SPHI|nr:hypothetical protein [Mucilaginibacter mali]QKJ29734.1 hypothetical protein HQ865_08170 [Mucilaginibacter mali]